MMDNHIPLRATHRPCLGRTMSFKALSPADTELVGDDALEEVEEALELEEDDGIMLEPFNLAQERQEGFFDEEGHYVEKRDKDEEEAEKDAWFTSTKGDQHLCTK